MYSVTGRGVSPMYICASYESTKMASQTSEMQKRRNGTRFVWVVIPDDGALDISVTLVRKDRARMTL